MKTPAKNSARHLAAAASSALLLGACSPIGGADPLDGAEYSSPNLIDPHERSYQSTRPAADETFGSAFHGSAGITLSTDL